MKKKEPDILDVLIKPGGLSAENKKKAAVEIQRLRAQLLRQFHYVELGQAISAFIDWKTKDDSNWSLVWDEQSSCWVRRR